MKNVLKLIIAFSLIPMLCIYPFHKSSGRSNNIRLRMPQKELLNKADSNLTLIGRWPFGSCYAVKTSGNYALGSAPSRRRRW